MIFVEKSPEKQLDELRKRVNGWRPYFAILPQLLHEKTKEGEYQWAWLEFVERQGHVPMNGKWWWEYRRRTK